MRMEVLLTSFVMELQPSGRDLGMVSWQPSCPEIELNAEAYFRPRDAWPRRRSTYSLVRAVNNGHGAKRM